MYKAQQCSFRAQIPMQFSYHRYIVCHSGPPERKYMNMVRTDIFAFSTISFIKFFSYIFTSGQHFRLQFKSPILKLFIQNFHEVLNQSFFFRWRILFFDTTNSQMCHPSQILMLTLQACRPWGCRGCHGTQQARSPQNVKKP